MGILKDKWNKNKFSVYESEEKTVLKLTQNMYDWLTNFATEIDNKTDVNGDHKGTWQGLNRPTLSDEGMRASVEKIVDVDIPSINEEISKHTSNLNDRGINAMFPPSPLVGIKADGFTDDSDTLNNLINYAALNGKRLILPSGTICIAKPLFFPTDSDKWGIEISGVKSETKYQNLPGSSSTIIKAIANIPYMISNRSGYLTSYYNVLKNVVLDGNNLAEVGYLNGWQDKIENTTILRCTSYGIRLSDYTNMTFIKEVTLVKNANGLISDGVQTTTWFMDKCTVRENTQNGIVIESALGVSLSNTVIESNGGIGAYILGGNNVDKYINGVKFNICYWENNTGYDIQIDRNGTVSPKNINFERPYINGNTKALNLKYGEYIQFQYPTFTGTPTTENYIIVENANYVVMEGDENALSPANINMSGTNVNNVTLIMDKFTGTTKGKVINNVLKVPIIKPDVVRAGTTITLNEKQVSGTIVTNAGQVAESIVTLPLPNENYNFKVICSLTSSYKWRIKSTVANTIYFNGDVSPKSYIEIATPSVGSYIEFIAVRDGNGTYAWVCIPHIGTWVSGI